MNDGMSSGELCDVSFAGSTITIAGISITQFMDDANPVEFQDVEVSSVGVNCNGKMIRNAKPNLIMMSVTVIPGSNNDSKLYDLWTQYRVQDGKNNGSTWEKPLTATISLKTIGLKKGSYKFTGGTMVSGPAGPVSSAEGKLQGRTYSFAFASVG